MVRKKGSVAAVCTCYTLFAALIKQVGLFFESAVGLDKH